mmetsp:Transcript_36153/g.96029  ORF Transcript_36153/g.96029 Transcript_36153/m.96029 type:complete len:81 (-) Transcript_36153:231-473(-)
MQSDDSAAVRLRHLLILAHLVPVLPFRIVVRSLPLLTMYLLMEPNRHLAPLGRIQLYEDGASEFLLPLAGASLLAAFGGV